LGFKRALAEDQTMVERRGNRIMHDVGLRMRRTDPVDRRGVTPSTSTFHLRWLDYLSRRRGATIGGV